MAPERALPGTRYRILRRPQRRRVVVGGCPVERALRNSCKFIPNLGRWSFEVEIRLDGAVAKPTLFFAIDIVRVVISLIAGSNFEWGVELEIAFQSRECWRCQVRGRSSLKVFRFGNVDQLGQT